MKNLPVQINQVVEQSKITDLTKAEQIAGGYAPFMEEVTTQINILKTLKKGNADDVDKAHRIRLDLGKICSKASALKKSDKDALLLQTRFIDALFNVVNGAARLTQDEAKEIEDHFINLEKERIEKLQAQRAEILERFEVEVVPPSLGAMELDVWNPYIKGIEDDYIAVKEAERKAKEKAALEAERRRLTSRLVEFIDNYDTIVFADLSEDDFLKLAKEAVAEREAKEQELEELKKKNAKLEAEAAENKAKIDFKLLSERKAREKAETEIKTLKEKEQAEAMAKEVARQAELNKGDEEKINDLIDDLQNLTIKYDFKSDKNQYLYDRVNNSIAQIIKDINETKPLV